MGSDVDAVTKSGRLFHTRAAATGNARSPTVDSRGGGTLRISGFVDDVISAHKPKLLDVAARLRQ